MIGLVGGVVEGGKDVLTFEKRVVLEDLVEGGSGAEQLEDIADTNAQAANAGTTTAFTGFDGDALEALAFHGSSEIEDTP